MDFKNIKLLGGIGTTLSLLGFVPVIGILLSIAGVVLMLIAFKKISDINPEEGIFTNFLMNVILSFIGGLVWGISATALIASNLNTKAILLWIIIWLILLGAGYFAKKALSSTAKVLNQDLFRLGGNFIFWGSVAVVIFIGFLAVFVGWILVAIAFFTLKDNIEATA